MIARAAASTALVGSLVLAACGSSSSDDGTPATGGSAGSSSGGSAGASGGAGAAGAGGSSGAASGGSAGVAGSAGAGGAGADADGDGLDDSVELTIAKSYYPYYSISPDDQCPLHGVLFRVSPHPDDATKLAIWYVVLYEKDCGAGGHVGDDEVFGAVVDPTIAAPGGLLAVRAISHQGTLCEHTTTCGSLPGCDPCTTASKGGQPTFLVFPSVNKHGNYADEGTCDLSVVCDFGGCTLNPVPDAPEFANAGEPGKPLTNDLTANGFITTQNGWKEQSLMGFDPWGSADFGGAGNVADDLADTAFLIPLSGC
jgi:hypothetical protein